MVHFAAPEIEIWKSVLSVLGCSYWYSYFLGWIWLLIYFGSSFVSSSCLVEEYREKPSERLEFAGGKTFQPSSFYSQGVNP